MRVTGYKPLGVNAPFVRLGVFCGRWYESKRPSIQEMHDLLGAVPISCSEEGTNTSIVMHWGGGIPTWHKQPRKVGMRTNDMGGGVFMYLPDPACCM